MGDAPHFALINTEQAKKKKKKKKKISNNTKLKTKQDRFLKWKIEKSCIGGNF